MELSLQRSRTAREMIASIDDLVKTFGYGGKEGVTDPGGWGTGESFTIADTQEVWHMEMIGMGKFSTGAVWVAQRVPDGYIGGHANQARITTFPRNDPDNCIFSPNVVSFAVQAGLYPSEAPPEAFSFADVYDPMSFTGARKCDARVWSFFSQVAESGFEKRYENYVQGRNLTDRMPLFVRAARQVHVQDLFGYMRSHYENTVLDDRQDVGAGGLHGTFRNGPSAWSSGGHQYVNERHVGTPYAATHYVAQLRPTAADGTPLPKPIGALNWFSVDDASFSVHAPFYASATRVPRSYSNAVGGADAFSFDSAFWIFNLVANFAYYRGRQVAPLVVSKVQQHERSFLKAVERNDKRALQLWKINQSEAVEYLTSEGEARGNGLVKDWLAFYQKLFMDFRDGKAPKGVASGYAQDWYDRIAKETGDKYLVPGSTYGELDDQKMAVLNRYTTS